MRIQRIIALIFASVLVFCLVAIAISWKSKKIQNQVNDTSDSIETLLRDIESLNRKLDRMIFEAGISIGYLQHLPPPTNGVKKSYHDGGHESAWIQDIDQNEGLVLVTTIDSKISIVFKPTADNLQKFHIGWIAPVTFQCTKVKKKKCDFSSPYKLFIGNGLVEVKQLDFPQK